MNEAGIKGGTHQSRIRPARTRLAGHPWTGRILGGMATLLLLALIVVLATSLGHDTSRHNQGQIGSSPILLSSHPRSHLLLQQQHAPVYMHQSRLPPHKQKRGPLKGAWDEPCAALQGELYVPSNDSQLVAPLVVMGHNRPDYLTRTIGNLLGVWRQDLNNAARFPLYISIDGSDGPTLERGADLCSDHGYLIQLLNHKHKPHTSNLSGANVGYSRLADHYKWILRVFFECYQAPRLILLEDDMLIAPDFFSYFHALAPIMDADNTTWCISCWNDNGQPNLVENNTRLYRTDYFPGLGWMTTRDKGLLMVSMWPRTHWDGYLRMHHGVHQCIYPEVSRTHTFGAVGTSGGQYYEDMLAPLELNSEPVQWEDQDLSYLLPNKYAARMNDWLAEAKPVTIQGLLHALNKTETSTITAAAYKVVYTAGSLSSFKILAEQIDKHIMTDECGS